MFSSQPNFPTTAEQIASAAIEAADAGAAVVHLHVRDPHSGKPSRAFELYEEVVQRIRESHSDVILNITAGMGARIASPSRAREILGLRGTQ